MEMENLQKFKKTSYIISFVFIILIILTMPINANFFQSNLIEFVKTKGIISIPIFKPAQKIEIKPTQNTILSAANKEDLNLEAGKLYFISQKQLRISQAKQDSELKTVWGVQIMAGSTKKAVEEFKAKASEKVELEFIILQEDGLYKLAAGFYDQRSEAEKLQQDLKASGYNGWTRELEILENKESSQTELEFDRKVEINGDSSKEALFLYNEAGDKLREAYVFEIEGKFKADSKELQGKFQFGPLANSVLLSYKTDIEELTAYLLQNYFSPAAPKEALKAQAVLYRTSILYQLETQGARLENLDYLKLGTLSREFKEAAAATRAQVLVKDNDFYYKHNYSFENINKPKAGIVALAQAKYSYQEIINYYYEGSKITNLNNLIDSEEKVSARIERGLYLKEIRQTSWAGPRIITVIDYDLKADGLSLKPVLAKGLASGREDLVDLIKKHKAIAGVNGGYFDSSGQPLGLLYINQMLVSEPLYNRSSLLIDQANNISFAQVGWQGELVIDSSQRKIKIDGVNRTPKKGELIVFNHFYGARMTALDSQQSDIVVRDNIILGIESKTGVKTAIPPDGFIIRFSNQNSDIKNSITKLIDQKVTLNYNFTPKLTEKNIIHAVGGGPRLLKGGEINISGQEENFKTDILKGRAPRTAVALTKNNHLLLLTIDGRQAELSVGMTLEEVAQTLKDLGAVEAINLDGGGSARMVIRGFTMSNPSERRLISNGVIVNQENN